jgi:hypothetical protein
MNIRQRLGNRLAAFLSSPSSRPVWPATCTPETLARTIRKGDVLLVEGSSRFSTAVKYLTQSTWSHSALCLSDLQDDDYPGVQLIEADVREGVRILPLDYYDGFHTRICRPVGLSRDDMNTVLQHALGRLGHQYDLRNVFDLMRYLIHTPPVPREWRRRMLALGSGDPTRAICSTLIAQAFQCVNYPILPEVRREKISDGCYDCYDEILHIRHYSLFAPRDFDISPYFAIIKPTLNEGFDPYALTWAEQRALS